MFWTCILWIHTWFIIYIHLYGCNIFSFIFEANSQNFIKIVCILQLMLRWVSEKLTMSFRRENSPARRPQSGRSTPTPYSWQQNRNLIPSHPEPFYQPNYPPYPGAMPNMQQYPPPGYYPPSSSCYPPQHYPPPHYAPAPMFPVPSEMPPLLPDPLIQRQTQFTPSSITHRPLFQSPPGPKPPVPQKPKMMPKMVIVTELFWFW